MPTMVLVGDQLGQTPLRPTDAMPLHEKPCSSISTTMEPGFSGPLYSTVWRAYFGSILRRSTSGMLWGLSGSMPTYQAESSAVATGCWAVWQAARGALRRAAIRRRRIIIGLLN